MVLEFPRASQGGRTHDCYVVTLSWKNSWKKKAMKKVSGHERSIKQDVLDTSPCWLQNHTKHYSYTCDRICESTAGPFNLCQALPGYFITMHHSYAFIKSREGQWCGSFTNKQTNNFCTNKQTTWKKESKTRNKERTDKKKIEGRKGRICDNPSRGELQHGTLRSLEGRESSSWFLRFDDPRIQASPRTL